MLPRNGIASVAPDEHGDQRLARKSQLSVEWNTDVPVFGVGAPVKSQW